MLKINDVVQFYNRYAYSMLSKKCPVCDGLYKINYDSNGNIKTMNCRCYYGFKQQDTKKINIPFENPKVGFGKIESVCVNITTGNIEYKIIPFPARLNPLVRFFSTEDGDLYNFLCEQDPWIIIDAEDVIRHSSCVDSVEVIISEYNYNINANDTVYFPSLTRIKDKCPLCNDTGKVLNINNNQTITCPNLSVHYSIFHYVHALKIGVVDSIDFNFGKRYDENSRIVFDQCYKCNVICNDNKYKLGFISDSSNFITKNMNEALILIDKMDEDVLKSRYEIY